jgi:ribosomal protein S18 acetylase RimI-like enzyme
LTEENGKVVTLKDGSHVLLRPYGKEDYDKLHEMFSSTSDESFKFQMRPTEKLFQHWTKDPNTLLFVAIPLEDNKIVAMADLYVQGHKAYFGLYVHDKFQNKGLGTLLTKNVIKKAKEKGLKKIYLEVAVENKRAVHMYEKCGFQIEGLLKIEHEING